MELKDNKLIANFAGVNIIEIKGCLVVVDEDGEFDIEDMNFYDPSSSNCPDSVWQNIYGKMSDKEMEDYITNIILKVHPAKDEYTKADLFSLCQLSHTTTPAIRTKSLLKVIKNKLILDK